MTKNQRVTLKAQPSKVKGKSSKEVVLMLQGELTIDNSPTIKDFLLENLAKYQQFTVKLNNIDNIDLGAIQLLQRFLWDAQKESKVVDFEMKLPEDIRILLERAGFQTFLSLSKIN